MAEHPAPGDVSNGVDLGTGRLQFIVNPYAAVFVQANPDLIESQMGQVRLSAGNHHLVHIHGGLFSAGQIDFEACVRCFHGLENRFSMQLDAQVHEALGYPLAGLLIFAGKKPPAFRYQDDPYSEEAQKSSQFHFDGTRTVEQDGSRQLRHLEQLVRSHGSVLEAGNIRYGKAAARGRRVFSGFQFLSVHLDLPGISQHGALLENLDAVVGEERLHSHADIACDPVFPGTKVRQAEPFHRGLDSKGLGHAK